MLPRMMLGVVLLLASAGLAFAEEAGDPPAITGNPDGGAVAMATICARCHRNAARVATDFDAGDPAAVAALDRFLATHHASGATMRADIIAYLASR